MRNDERRHDRNRRGRTCWNAALAKARRSRSKARRNPASAAVADLLFLIVLLASLVADMFGMVFAIPSAPRRAAGAAAHEDGSPSRPPNEYELGMPGPWLPSVPRSTDRYRGRRPTLSRLLRDLRRPSARKDAEAAVLALIPPGETLLRSWVAAQLLRQDYMQLAVWARPHLSIAEILQRWQDAAFRQADEDEAAALEALSMSPAAHGGPTGRM